MKRPILLFITTMAVLGCHTSARVVYQPVVQPATVKESVDVPALEKDYPNQDGVYLERDTSFEHVTDHKFIGNADWSFLETQSRKYVVLNPNAEWLSTFSVAVLPGYELESASLALTGPDGKSRTFGIPDLKLEQDSNGRKTYKLAYPDVRKGSIVHEAFVLKKANAWKSPPLSHDVPLQFSIPCKKASFRFLYPDWWTVQLKEIGSARALPVKFKAFPESKKMMMHYSGEDIPAIANEPFSPFFKEMAAYAEIQIKTLNLTNAVYRSSTTWAEYAKEFKDYALDRDPIFSRRVERTTADITKACKSEKEKLDAIVTWIQTNVEVGPSNGKNFADMLDKKKGNVYGIAGLAHSMLAKAGVTSKFLLIHSAEDGYFDKSFISMEELYYPALMAQVAGRSFLVFPYIKKLPVDHIPEMFQGQDALAIDGLGGSSLVKVPEGNLASNSVIEKYSLTIRPDGHVVVAEEKVLQGSNAYSVRRSLENMNPAETEKVLKGLLTYTDGKVEFKKFAFKDQEDYKKPLTIQLEYEIDNLVTITPEEVIFNTGGLFTPVSKLKTKVDPNERRNPVRIHYDESHRKLVNIHWPAAWTLSTHPADLTVENSFGRISGVYRVEGDSLDVTQDLVLKKAIKPKEALGELLQLTGNRSKLHIPTLVFRVKS